MKDLWDAGRFQEAREQTNFTSKDAAIALNIAPEYLSMIENGKKQPSSKLILRISKLYHQPPGYFLVDRRNGNL